MAYAHAHGLVLITFDRGFGDVVGIHPGVPGIVVINRFIRSQAEASASRIQQLLPQLQGHITVIGSDFRHRQYRLDDCRPKEDRP